jgi:hypothetical protein
MKKNIQDIIRWLLDDVVVGRRRWGPAAVGSERFISRPLRPANFSPVIKQVLVGLLVLVGTWGSVMSQNRPVTSTVQLMPPYSVYLADYARPGSEQMQVYLLLRDLSEPAYDIRLRLTIEGSGIRLQTNPAYQPPPITLEGGSPTIVSGETLAPYLDSRNLLFSGITQAEYEQRRALPEGFYQITVEVLDYRRADRVLSRPATFMAWFTLNEPPRITAPLCGTTLPLQEPTNILFQWMDGGNVNLGSPFATEYELTLVEVFPADRNVEDAIRSSVPLLQTITTETSYLYGLTDAALIPGQKYAFRVRALDTEVSTRGRGIFKNEGYSETCHFTYGDGLVLTPPDGIRVYAENAQKALVNWHLSVDPDRYRVEYRRKADEGEEALTWFSKETTDEQVVLRDLEPETTYEVRVASLFQGFVSRYSAVQTFTTPEVIAAACGVAPPHAITASTVPLTTALAGEYWQVGDFEMQVREVRGGDGVFSGWGVMSVPYLSMQMPVKFDQVWVDEDYNVVRGEVIALSGSLEAFQERWQQDNPQEDNSSNEVDELLADGETSPETDTPETNNPNTGVEVITVAVAAEVAEVYINEQGQVVAVDRQGNEEVVAEGVPEEGEALALQDSEGATFSVDSGGNVNSSGVNSNGTTDTPTASASPLLLAILDELEEAVNVWLQVEGKGPLSNQEMQVLASLPAGFPQDAELLAHISEQTFARARQEHQDFQQAIEQRDHLVGALLQQGSSSLSKTERATVQREVALQLTLWGLIDDLRDFLNELGLQGDCLDENLEAAKVTFLQKWNKNYSPTNLLTAGILAFNASTVNTLFCLSSRESCKNEDYWIQFGYGVVNALVEEIDLNSMVEGGLKAAKTYLENKITCLKNGTTVMVAFTEQNGAELFRSLNRCYLGVNMGLEETAQLYQAAKEYAIAHYDDPYDQGKATVFVLSIVSPFGKVNKVTKTRMLTKLEQLGSKVDDGLAALKRAVDTEDSNKVLDELADVSKKGKVLSDVNKALAVDGMPSASGQFRQFSLSIDDEVKNLRAGNFAKKIDSKFNHYLSPDGQYYVKHCPNTGELLLVDVKKKEYLGYAIDQVDRTSGLKLIQNSTPREFEKAISIWKRLKGLDEATEIYVKGRKISLPHNKITIVLGKFSLKRNPFGYLTTKDVFNELGLNNLKYWELSKNLTPSSQRIHVLNLPDAAYTPPDKDWWTAYNAQLIDDIIMDPDKYNVVILTDVVKPDGIAEVNDVLKGIYSEEINALRKHFDFKIQGEFWTIKVKDQL